VGASWTQDDETLNELHIRIRNDTDSTTICEAFQSQYAPAGILKYHFHLSSIVTVAGNKTIKTQMLVGSAMDDQTIIADKTRIYAVKLY
jgi:primosomal replication protein N